MQVYTEQTETVAALRGQRGDEGKSAGKRGRRRLHPRPWQEGKQTEAGSVGGKKMLREDRAP